MASQPTRTCAHPGCKTTIGPKTKQWCREHWRNRGPDAQPSVHLGQCGHPVSRKGHKYCRPCYNLSFASAAMTAGRSAPVPDTARDQASDLMFERLRGETKLYRKAYESAIKSKADEERLIDLFRCSISAFPKLPADTFKVSTKSRQPTLHTETPALLLGDQQIGEHVSLTETNGLNEYNFGVYQSRLEYLEDRVVDILLHHQQAPFEEVVVFSMGDNVSGVIHEELQKYGHQHIVDQVYLGALTSALFLYRLLARLRPRGVKRIRVSCVSGNHGRLSKDKESKQYFKNFDYLFHSIMAQALSAVPEIEFSIPRCLFTVVEIANHRVLQSHGHELPPSSLGIPLYSINRASAGYQELLSWQDDPSRFDYWVMGHFHRPMQLDNAIVNGTMAGLTEFGIGRFKPIKPIQKLLGFHPKYGLAWQYSLQLDHAPQRPLVYTFDSDMGTGDAVDLFRSRTLELAL